MTADGALPPRADRAAPLLLHVFPGFGIGGAQVRFAAIANRFGPRWRHAIVALNGATQCAERLHPTVPYELIPAPSAGEEFLPRRLRAIRRLLRERRPAALVTSNWGSIEWAIANLGWPPRVPHLHTEDGFGPEEAERQIPRRVWTRRLVLNRATVALPSRTLLDLARKTWRLPAARLRYIPNGVDLARFAPQALRPDGPLVIGTVATLRPEKNLPRLLRAFAQVAPGREARLIIVGDGPERGRLQALAAELGVADSASFPGHQPDPAAAYRGFNLFALSSDTEQMPISVLEAMASGLPVAATDVGDVRHMLDGSNAPFIVARDEAALAGALAALLDEPELRHRLGVANRARAEAVYDERDMFAAWAGLYDSYRRP